MSVYQNGRKMPPRGQPLAKEKLCGSVQQIHRKEHALEVGTHLLMLRTDTEDYPCPRLFHVVATVPAPLDAWCELACAGWMNRI